MKPLLALLAVALLSLAATACGSTDKDSHGGTGKGTPPGGSGTTTTNTTSGGAPATAASNASESSFRGDEDDDETAGNHTGNNKYDNDADFDNDTHENTGYRDSDDSTIETFGHAPSAADKRAITALVSRYFAAAAAGNGANACPLMYSILEEAIAEDYGQPPGPAYARGKTCAVVLSKLFKHSHGQLTGPTKVTGVRVNGKEARALLGSATMPASFILVKREHSTWKINGLLGEPLP